MELTQAEVDSLVEKRIAKLRRHHGRKTALLITMCAALAREVGKLRHLLRIERGKQKGKKR